MDYEWTSGYLVQGPFNPPLPFIFSSAGLVLAVMAPRLSVSTRSDMVWQRVSWKLLENVPQRWVESVLTGLVQAVSG